MSAQSTAPPNQADGYPPCDFHMRPRSRQLILFSLHDDANRTRISVERSLTRMVLATLPLTDSMRRVKGDINAKIVSV